MPLRHFHYTVPPPPPQPNRIHPRCFVCPRRKHDSLHVDVSIERNVPPNLPHKFCLLISHRGKKPKIYSMRVARINVFSPLSVILTTCINPHGRDGVRQNGEWNTGVPQTEFLDPPLILFLYLF